MPDYRFHFAIVFASTLALCVGSVLHGQESQGDEAEVRRSAEFLQAAAEALSIEADEADKSRLVLRKAPLFKYCDPARGYSAAGVWRLGEKGRPQALVSLEYWLRGETPQPHLMYELVSFTEARFTVASARAKLPADGGAPMFTRLTALEKPAAGEKQRLVQLRSLARRFTISERNMGDFSSLRLLTQPIDRYDDAEQGITDGGLFVFVYGTNPEAALWLEADKEGWRYALSRMTWAEVVAQFDGKEVARFEQLTGFPASGPYRSAGHVIDTPLKP